MNNYIDYHDLKRDCLLNLLDDYEQTVQNCAKGSLKLREIPTINGYLNSDVTLSDEEYKNAKITELEDVVARIIDEFDELLAKHNIYIPDDNRQGEKDEACIFGDAYYSLEETIKNIIKENL